MILTSYLEDEIFWKRKWLLYIYTSISITMYFYRPELYNNTFDIPIAAWILL